MICPKCGYSGEEKKYEPDYRTLKPNLMLIQEIFEAGLTETRLIYNAVVQNQLDEKKTDDYLAKIQPLLIKLNDNLKELYVESQLIKKMVPIDVLLFKTNGEKENEQSIHK